MKRKLLFAACLLCMAVSFHSCELETCKICQQNTYDQNDNLLNEGTETEYCGASLLRIEATPPATVLGVTTKWECR